MINITKTFPSSGTDRKTKLPTKHPLSATYQLIFICTTNLPFNDFANDLNKPLSTPEQL